MKRRSDHRVKRCLTQGALQSEHKPEHISVHIKEGHEPQPARQRVSQRASIPLTGTLLRLELACEQFPDRIRFNTPGTDLMGTDLMRELSFLRPAPTGVLQQISISCLHIQVSSLHTVRAAQIDEAQNSPLPGFFAAFNIFLDLASASLKSSIFPGRSSGEKA